MKLGIFFQNNRQGGLDTFLINLISNFPNKNIDLIVFCNKSHPGLNFLKSKLKNVQFIEYNFLIYDDLKTKFKDSKFLQLIIKILFGLFGNFYQIIKIIFIINKNNLDNMFVVSGGFPGGDANVSALIAWGIKNKKEDYAIYNFHNNAKAYPNSIIFKSREIIIDTLITKYSKKIVTVSNSCLQTTKKRKFLNNTDKKFIYNGLAIDKNFNNFDIRTSLNISDKNPIILMLGVYEERKGHIFMLRAMKHVLNQNQSPILLMCGDGEDDYKKNLIKYAQKLNIENNIYILNHVDNPINLIKSCSIVVMPSQDYESFGYTALEAMYCKRPVVCCNTGGLNEVVENGITGYVVDKSDDKAFARKILYLLENKEISSVMGQKGFDRYHKNFTAKKMSQKYYDIIFNS